MRNLLVGALLACSAGTAAAQVYASPPGYIGAGLGISRYHDFCAAGGGTCDEDGTAWRVQAGYMWRPWIGLEGAFIHFGEAHQPGFLLSPPPNTTPLPSASDGRTYAMGLSVLLRAPLGPVGLHAQLGYAAVQDYTSGAVTYFNSEARESKGRVIYGLGGTFDFGAQWQARFDWDRTEGKDNINPKYDVDAYTLGVGYRF
jgi:hypothetical protein